jgi:hypothetical protein
MALDRNRFIGGDSAFRLRGKATWAAQLRSQSGGRLHQMIAALSNAIGHRLSNAE